MRERASLWVFFFAAAALNAGQARAQCAAPGDACDDGRWCTEMDQCDSSLACVGVARDCLDGIGCTDDICNEATDTCDHPPDPMGTSCSDGAFCTEGDACDGSGACMPGPPRRCVDGLSCTVDRCNEADNVCENPIRAGSCLIDGSCRFDGEGNPDFPCQICDPDVLDDDWSPGPGGTICGESSCAAGVRTDQVCDATGACGDSTVPCEFGVCHDDRFCASCSVDDDCPERSYCRGTECVLAAPGGAVCDRDRRCLSANCANGVCCDRRCDGPCESCIAGACTPEPPGTNPGGVCGDSTCDGTGRCVGDAPDAGSDGGGPANLVGHGSGCIACAIGTPPEEAPTPAIVLFLTGVALILRRPKPR